MSNSKPLDKLLASLQERAKELNCLYRIDDILKNLDEPLDSIFARIIEALPPGWQYPDVCQAKITYDGKEYRSAEFQESPWRQSADIVVDKGPNYISRENVQRKIVVQANVSGRDVRSVVEEIKSKIGQNVNLPQGYYVAYGGQFESAEQATRMITMLSILSIMAILIALYIEFRNFTGCQGFPFCMGVVWFPGFGFIRIDRPL